MFGLKIVRVFGGSMAPHLPDGSYALFRRSQHICKGDTVLVDHPEFGSIVKTVASIDPSGVALKGMSPASTSPHRLGRVPVSAIRGRLILRLFKPNRPMPVPT